MTKAIILDANRIGKNMREEVKEAILKDEGVKILIFKDGKLERELKGKREHGGKWYKEYKNFKAFKYVCQRSVARKNRHLIQKELIESDDQHIIALALVTGANTLHTEDQKLIADFQRCNDIDNQTCCIQGRQNPDRKVIRAASPCAKDVRRLLRLAEARFDCCECMINDGGC